MLAQVLITLQDRCVQGRGLVQLIPVQSPLLRESYSIDSPPLTCMLKLSAFAHLTSWLPERCLRCLSPPPKPGLAPTPESSISKSWVAYLLYLSYTYNYCTYPIHTCLYLSLGGADLRPQRADPSGYLYTCLSLSLSLSLHIYIYICIHIRILS